MMKYEDGIDPRTEWRSYATWKLGRVRQLIRAEMSDDEQLWPIWIIGTGVGFPGDDAVAPRGAANDRFFTVSGG
jgi:hypothetical protein